MSYGPPRSFGGGYGGGGGGGFGGGGFGGYYDDDDGAAFRVPDRDVYRRNISTFGSVHTYLQNRFYVRSWKDRRILQPHFSSLKDIQTPYGNISTPTDGICAHFLRKGLIKPNKTQMNAAVWSADARWLVLGTQSGDLALWEGDTLKVHKVVSVPAHKVFERDMVIDSVPITAMAWNNHGNILVTGDNRGVMQYCDEAFRNITIVPGAHTDPIRGLSFSPLDSKLVSCSDDTFLHIWVTGEDEKPERTLKGHQSDVKSVDWHPYRALVASGSRDTTVKLWDPRQENALCSIFGHKKQVNAVKWCKNGNWLASGSKDGIVKIYDIRTMKEMEALRGHNCDVCSLGWHPQHESLLMSGGYNGSLIYWLIGHNQAPHTMIADAHKQSVDVIAWHPAGHCVGTASHDGILKFWCREPPGSKLEPEVRETADNPVVDHGPVEIGQPSVIPPAESFRGFPPGPSGVGGMGGPPFSSSYGGHSGGRGGGGHGGEFSYGGDRGDRPPRFSRFSQQPDGGGGGGRPPRPYGGRGGGRGGRGGGGGGDGDGGGGDMAGGVAGTPGGYRKRFREN